MTDRPKDTDDSEETHLPSLPCLYCAEPLVYVRQFRWNATDHLACHCRNCGHRWQMRERNPADET